MEDEQILADIDNQNPQQSPPIDIIIFLENVLEKIKNKLGHSERLDTIIYSLRGALKGFLVYLVPISFLKRKLNKKIIMTSLASGSFVGVVRLIDRWFAYKHRRKLLDPDQKVTLFAEDEEESSEQLDIVNEKKEKIEKLLVGRYRLFIAGFVACGIGLLIDNSLQNSIFTFWILVRAARAIYPKRYNHPLLPILFLCLSSSVVLGGWIGAPDEVDPGYLRFLDVHGGLDKKSYKLLRARPSTSICHITHPWSDSCMDFTIAFLKAAIFRSLKVYLPLSVVMFFISKSKNVQYFFINLTRSTLFLALYCTIAFSSSCYFYRIFPGLNRKKLMLHTWTAGLAGFVERQGRRIELAGYVCTYGLDVIYRGLIKRKYVKPNFYIGSLLMMVCIGVLLHHHEQQPNFFTSWLLGISRKPVPGKSLLVPLLHGVTDAQYAEKVTKALLKMRN
eukprot:TRINITY_DN606_c0_g1_i1.p1 TRINITY_DN606_c0_g1~~TRINITY_DN606_c0_g1_i1.p1  ORF type:complete len:447 (-),score=121.14 TRINITY_DN606_c0_g1_i1:105-1445(-)